MTRQDYIAQAEINIKAPLNKVWEALTNPKIVKLYFHNTDLKTDWKIGSPITWEGTWNDKLYKDKGIILKYVVNKELSMSHWSPLTGIPDKPENYYIVTYKLSRLKGFTILKLTQTNNTSQEEATNTAKYGWYPILDNLKQILEK